MVSKCGKLAQIWTEYKGRHDNVARYIHWQLCGKCGLQRANSHKVLTTGVKIAAYSFHTQLGMRSGPVYGSFSHSSRDRKLKT